MQNETLIAIKAPLGTTLEVPDPDEVLLFKMNILLVSFLLVFVMGDVMILESWFDRQWSTRTGDFKFCFAVQWGPSTYTLSGRIIVMKMKPPHKRSC